jgi:hypothetical protein
MLVSVGVYVGVWDSGEAADDAWDGSEGDFEDIGGGYTWKRY